MDANVTRETQPDGVDVLKITLTCDEQEATDIFFALRGKRLQLSEKAEKLKRHYDMLGGNGERAAKVWRKVERLESRAAALMNVESEIADRL